MSIALLFWVLFIVAVVFGVYLDWSGGPRPVGRSVLFFVLVGLLGWAVFGAAVHR